MKIVCGLSIGAIALLCGALQAQIKPRPAGDKPARAATADESQAREEDTRVRELTALRASSAAFQNAFNQHDAQSLAEQWTVDGEYVDEAGRVYRGREAIEKEYQDYFAVNDDVKIAIVVDALRLLSDTAAIEDGRTYLEPLPAGAPAMGRYTVVHVKVGDKWLMSSVREGRIETPSGYNNVADLEWLIGTWTAEEHGAKMVSVCRWVANKSFVQRTYTVTHADHSQASGVQIIGFNPAAGHVQSWNFSSDGGHAIGVWTARDGGWQAELEGVTGEGVATSAVNVLTKIDDNAYSWRAVQRTAGGTALPNTDEVVMKRAPADSP
jgi:uncharacterized protein (TIGR02246 family)